MLNPYFESFGDSALGRRRGPAGAGHVRHRLRHALEVARRPVHVPLLGERHDAADAAARPERPAGRSRSSITDAGSGVDPRSLTATVDGARRPRALRRRHGRRPRRPGQAHGSSSRPPTTRRRRTWRTSRRSSRTRRRSRGPSSSAEPSATSAAWRRARRSSAAREVALDRPRELLASPASTTCSFVLRRARSRCRRRVRCRGGSRSATTRRRRRARPPRRAGRRRTGSRPKDTANARSFLAARLAHSKRAAATRAPRRRRPSR